MNNKQFSDRIGNIDDQLIRQAEQLPNYTRARRANIARRLLALAAVIALMTSSFAIGALAFSKETIVEIKVPMPQQALELSDIGITLILPDSWNDKYALEINELGEYIIYNPSIRDACDREAGFETNCGILFYIVKWDQQLTAEQHRADGEWNYARNRYIMSTKHGTYLLYYASDVQFTADTMEEYRQMEQEIALIRFVVDSALS